MIAVGQPYTTNLSDDYLSVIFGNIISTVITVTDRILPYDNSITPSNTIKIKLYYAAQFSY